MKAPSKNLLKKKSEKAKIFVECESDLYDSLKTKLKAEGSTMRKFFETYARFYISSKE